MVSYMCYVCVVFFFLNNLRLIAVPFVDNNGTLSYKCL